MFFTDEDSIPTESQFHHSVSYFAPHSPEIADNEEELSDSHSFDEQNHTMNENTGGNVADITSKVQMVEKSQNQEICLTGRPEHQDEHHESRETIAFLKEKKGIQEKVRARSRPRIQEDQCRQRWAVILATKAVS